MHFSSSQVKHYFSLICREWGGSETRKELRRLYLRGIILEEEREEIRGGAYYTCASLTPDKKFFQPTRVYRVTFTKAQVSGGSGWGAVEGAGKTMEEGQWGWDDRRGRGQRERLERETESARDNWHMSKDYWCRSQSGSQDGFPYIPQCTDSKECLHLSSFLLFFLLFHFIDVYFSKASYSAHSAGIQSSFIEIFVFFCVCVFFVFSSSSAQKQSSQLFFFFFTQTPQAPQRDIE